MQAMSEGGKARRRRMSRLASQWHCQPGIYFTKHSSTSLSGSKSRNPRYDSDRVVCVREDSWSLPVDSLLPGWGSTSCPDTIIILV